SEGNVSLGKVVVELGDPKFRVSSKSPKQGDKIVTSTSDYGVVREYTFNPAGKDITLKEATIEIDWADITVDGESKNELKDAVRSVELYDANTGSVIKTYDIKDNGSFADGKTPNGAPIKLTGLNWTVDKTFDLQVRAVAAA